MQGKVSRKSQYGFQVEGKEGWINYGKYYKGTKDFAVGSTVEYEVKVNGEFSNLTSLTVVGSATSSTNGTSSHAVSKAHSPETQLQIARMAAVKAFLGSSVISNLDISQVISEMRTVVPLLTGYILNGKFDVVENREEANVTK